MSLPTYPWFDQVPSHMKTRRQLAELGLRPGGPVVAQVVWRRGERWADLYDLNTAKPKRAATPAQLAALEKAQLKRRLCPRCGKDTGEVVWRRFRPSRDCPHCVEVIERRAAARRRQEAADAAAMARLWLRSSRTVILDTETTDLNGYLVQIAVIQATDGAVLLDTLVNPLSSISAGARAIHGISDEQLADAPTFEQIEPQLAAMLRGRRIITYNASFDLGILRNEIHRLTGANEAAELNRWLRPRRWHCAMELYAIWFGEWSDYHGSYRRQPLAGGDHSALGDAQACLQVLQQMAETKEEFDEDHQPR